MILLWGSNARNAHPIFFHHVLKGIHNGARLIVVDPRRSETAQWADVWLGNNVGSDIALANAIGREIIHAGLADMAFIERATENFEAYKALVEEYTLERAERAFSEITFRLVEASHAGRQDLDVVREWLQANHSFHDVIYAAAEVPLIERMAKAARKVVRMRRQMAETRPAPTLRQTPPQRARAAAR